MSTMNLLHELAHTVDPRSGPDQLTSDVRARLAALLRAASAETVGTEWAVVCDPDDESENINDRCGSRVNMNHNADLHAARLAIAGLKAERDEAKADKAEVLRSADRLYRAASEQQYTLGSKGWNWTDDLRWSKAGAQWHQYRELNAAILDMADVMQAKNPSKLEARGPYAEVVAERDAALASLAEKQRAIDEALRQYDLWMNSDDDDRHADFVIDSLVVTLSPHATKATEANSSATVTGSTLSGEIDAMVAILKGDADEETKRSAFDTLEEIVFPSVLGGLVFDQPSPETTPTAAAATPAADACDTRELVARLAEAIARYFDDGEETVINLINRVRDIENAARRGGGA